MKIDASVCVACLQIIVKYTDFKNISTEGDYPSILQWKSKQTYFETHLYQAKLADKYTIS